MEISRPRTGPSTAATPADAEWRSPPERLFDLGGAARSGSEALDPSFTDTPIYEHFREAAARHPDKVAVDDGRLRLTYGQVRSAADRLARAIRSAAPEAGPVGILLPNAAWFPVAALACLAGGRPYVALDLHYPAGRNAEIIACAGLSALIVHGHEGAEEFGIPAAVRRIDVAEALLAPDVGPDEGAPPMPVDDPAVILFTSGSTGRPKGIVNSQRSVLQRVLQYVNACRVGPEDGFLPLNSPCTIVGVREGFTALLTGATLHVLDPQRTGLREIRRVLQEARVTVCYAVPTLLRCLAGVEEDTAPFETLRVVRVGGERVLWSDVELLRRVLPPACRIMVAYSSTETTGSHWFVPPDFRTDEAVAPVGHMLPGATFAILGEDGMPVPDGEAGELVVRGPHVALGHWEDGRCVAGPMRPDPLDPAARILRTGDLVSMDADGLLRVVGRIDRQIKVRGQRVEPAELEAVLRRSPEVAEAAVAARRADDGDVLVAFVAPRPGTAPSLAGDLIASIRASLPSALHPVAVHVLDALPRLPSGKLDLGALQEMDRLRAAVPGAAPGPGPASLQAVRRAWTRALGQHSFDEGRSWQDSGGDSLRLLRFAFELEEALGHALPLDLLGVHMRPAEMASTIEGVSSRPALGPARERRPTVVLLPGIGGDVPSFVAFRDELAGEVHFVTARYPGWPEMSKPGFRFEDVAAAVCAQVQATAPDGPVRLAGWSFGGLVALAVAQRLLQAGREVAFLGLFDTDLTRLEGSARRGGPGGFLHRVRRLPHYVRHGGLNDELSRIAAHYLQAPRARGLSLLLTGPLPFGALGRTRFAIRFWLCRHRRVDLARRWLERHPPDLSGVAVVLFQATSGQPEIPVDLAWKRLCPSLRAIPVPGDHDGMFDMPHRPVLAARFLEALAETSRRTAADGGGPSSAERGVL